MRSVYYGIKGITLSDIVKMLEIKLETGEKLSEELKNVMNSSADIDIYRMHTVKVTSDWITVEVKLAGTVADAIKEAKVVLGDKDTVNFDLKEKLVEGMDILVYRGATEEEESVALSETPAWFDTQAENNNSNNNYSDNNSYEEPAREQPAQNNQAAEEAARAAEEAAKAAEEAARQAAEEESRKAAEAAAQAAEESRRAAEEAARAAEEAAQAAQEVETYITYEDTPGGRMKVTHYSDGRPDDEELIP